VGLVGFGTGNLSGNVKTIGKIGDTEITVNQYVRALQSELRNSSQQFGQQLTLQQLQAFGIQQRVLARLVTDKLLENEASKLSLSVDDQTVRNNIVALNAFKGPDGSFNQDAYNYALENAGYTSAEFEEEIRAETSRNILSQSILSGIVINSLQAQMLASFLLEERSFNIQTFTLDNVNISTKNPSIADLKTFLEDNIDTYTVPKGKKITYAALQPKMLLDSVETNETILRSIYEENKQEYNQSEQRTLDRLSFLTVDEANSAISDMNSNITDFDKLILDRNLTNKDVLYGTFTKEQLLDGNELVFAAKANEHVGPIETDLGPVIFRVREIISATSTSYEEVKSTLEKDYKLSESIKLIDAKIEEAQNLLAAGGTLDDLKTEMGFEIEKILFNAEENIPILENKNFYETAQKAKVNDFPEIKELSSGMLFALRVDEDVDARLRKVDEIRTELTNAWQEQQVQIELDDFAKDLLSKNQYKGEILNFNKQTREKILPDLPAEIITEVFNLSIGEGTIVSGDQKSYIVRLKDISNADLSSDNAKLLVSQIKNQINNSLSADLFESFATMARVNSKLNLNEQAVNAVHSSFQ